MANACIVAARQICFFAVTPPHFCASLGAIISLEIFFAAESWLADLPGAGEQFFVMGVIVCKLT